MQVLVRCAWCVVAGLGTSLAFPPQDLAAIAWFGLVPWLISLHRARLQEAVAYSAVFALSLALPLGAWIPAVARDGFGAGAFGAYGLWVLAALAYVPAIVVLGIGLRVITTGPAVYPLAAGLGWALVELWYSFVWPQVPWVLLGATQIDSAVSATAAVAGVHGVSALVVTVNALLAQAVLRVSLLRTAAVAVGVASIGLLAGAVSTLDAGDAATRAIRVALVQPALPMRARPDSLVQEESVATLIALSRELPRVDLVLWPENALAASIEGRPDLASQVADLANEIGAPIWAGVHRVQPGARLNSIARFAPGKAPEPIYDKARLLPFTERIPAWIPARALRTLGSLVPPLPFRPGKLREHTEPRSELFLCFEAAFSGPPTDAEASVLVNLVNDGWYDRTLAAEQLLLLSRWRAIEAGAPLVRVASTGISALVLPTGEIASSLPVGRRGALVSEVPLRGYTTPFERLGHAPILVGALLTWGIGLTRTRAGESRASPRPAS